MTVKNEGLEIKDEIKPETDDQNPESESEEDESESEVGESESAESDSEQSEDSEEEVSEAPTLEQIRENIKQHDDQMRDDREEFEFYETKLETIRKDIIGSLPDYTANGKSIYDMDQDEFDNVIDRTYAENDRDAAQQMVGMAREARKQYFEKIKPYAADASKLQERAEASRAREWELAAKEIKALHPGIEKYEQELNAMALKELEASPLLVKRVNMGVAAKFKYLANLVKQAGIEEKLTAAETKKEQGNREKALASKGKRSSRSDTRETVFTSDQIKKMTPEEWRKNKDSVMRQQRAAEAARRKQS